MANLINADPTNGLKLISDGSSEIQIQSNGVTVATINSSGLSMNTGTLAGNGPTFSAYRSTNQAITGGVTTKVAFDTEEWDTNSNYDNATNYRFTPTVAGYYQISSFVNSAYSATPAEVLTIIYKNGSEQRKLQQIVNSNYSRGCGGSALVYANGSTDYFEIYHYSGGSTNIESGVFKTYFQAVLVRAA
jgi:hypothetical protein